MMKFPEKQEGTTTKMQQDFNIFNKKKRTSQESQKKVTTLIQGEQNTMLQQKRTIKQLLP